MKLSKIFTVMAVFFMLLFIPTNIYAATTNTSVARQIYSHKLYLKVGMQSRPRDQMMGSEVLSWKSSKNSVVRIHKKTGKIWALKGGSSIITQKTKNGGSTSYLVVVYDRKIQLPEPDPNRPFIISYGSTK